MINRNNYEAWFLDFAEGALSDNEINALYDFLEKNMDLKDEFEEFNLVFLDDETFEYSDKDSLIKDIDIEKIEGLNDFEVLAIKKIENDLTKKEEKELNSILKFYPKLQMEYKLLLKTKLSPDKSIVFAEKDKLKKSSGIVIPIWVKYASSIAAIGLLILFVTKVVNNNDKSIENGFALESNKQNIESTNTKVVIKSEKIVNSDLLQKDFDKDVKNEVQIKEPNLHIAKIVVENSKIKGKTTQNIDNNNRIDEINDFQIEFTDTEKVEVAKAKIPNGKFEIIKFGRAKINKIPLEIERESLAILHNNKPYSSVALTPKEFIIKTVKSKLDIEDEDYNKIESVELVSATMEKFKIGKIDYKKKAKKKHFSIKIGSLGFERSWN